MEKIDDLYQHASEGIQAVAKESLDECYDKVTHPDLLVEHLNQFAHLLDDHDQSYLDYLTDKHRVFADDINN